MIISSLVMLLLGADGAGSASAAAGELVTPLGPSIVVVPPRPFPGDRVAVYGFASYGYQGTLAAFGKVWPMDHVGKNVYRAMVRIPRAAAGTHPVRFDLRHSRGKTMIPLAPVTLRGSVDVNGTSPPCDGSPWLSSCAQHVEDQGRTPICAISDGDERSLAAGSIEVHLRDLGVTVRYTGLAETATIEEPGQYTDEEGRPLDERGRVSKVVPFKRGTLLGYAGAATRLRLVTAGGTDGGAKTLCELSRLSLLRWALLEPEGVGPGLQGNVRFVREAALRMDGARVEFGDGSSRTLSPAETASLRSAISRSAGSRTATPGSPSPGVRLVLSTSDGFSIRLEQLDAHHLRLENDPVLRYGCRDRSRGESSEADACIVRLPSPLDELLEQNPLGPGAGHP